MKNLLSPKDISSNQLPIQYSIVISLVKRYFHEIFAKKEWE